MTVPGTRAELSQVLLALGVGTLVFFGSAMALHALIHDPLRLHADMRSEKLVMLDRWHGRLFSAAFGSSHIHNGFDPRAFDKELSGGPLATRSANLAIEGGSQSEQHAMALQFVKHLVAPTSIGAPLQPCFIMLEADAGANFTNDHLVHPRAINIYDWATAKLIFDFTTPQMSRAQRVGRMAYALAASGLYYLNVGMLSNLIFSPPLNEEVLLDETAEDRRGEKIEPPNPSAVATIRGQIATWPARLPVQEGILPPGSAELVQQIAAASPVNNLSFVYLLYPRAGDGQGVRDYPDHLNVPTSGGRLVVPVINLARPDRFHQIYDPNLWHDDAHLNGDGADVVSATLAQQLKLWYAAHGLPRPCGG